MMESKVIENHVVFSVYVLKNASGNFYKGHTNDIDGRIREHNAGLTKSTRNRGPWSLVYKEDFQTREEAIKRERYFKTAAGRRFLKKVIV